MFEIRKLLGLEEYSSSVKKYFDKSNAVSGITLSVIIIALEAYMILSLSVSILLGRSQRSPMWMLTHFGSYVLLILVSIPMLIYSLRFIRGKNPSRLAGKIIRVVFVISCISFGIAVSYFDYKKGEQMLVFITMCVLLIGLIAWRPCITLVALSVSYLVFVFLCGRAVPLSFASKINLFISYIAFIAVGINIFLQKLAEARKDEGLEKINDYLKEKTVRDDLTGIPNMHYFRNKALTKILDYSSDISNLVFLFLDIENFKSYNDRYGFPMGNELLRNTADSIRTVFPMALIARFSDDHFVVMTEREGAEDKVAQVRRMIKESESEVPVGLKAGAYVPKDREIMPATACDRACYACQTIKKKYKQDFCEYTDEMDKQFRLRQYIIDNIDKAVSSGYIKVFYQPVMRADDKKLCGLEALARWSDPIHGMLSPAVFVPVLEEYRQIHKLDMKILEQVASDIRQRKDDGEKPIPVSINFSRLDFEAIDVVGGVEECIKRHGIEKNDIHVEITESALNDNSIQLQKAMGAFRDEGYELWLDDFGSGYSGLNVLKDFEFDMMKIDMKFLTNFSMNEKIRPILRSIIALAKEIGMQTLTEGVETDEAFEFLRSIGCERVQGYLFGKPMPKEDILAGIESGKYVL